MWHLSRWYFTSLRDGYREGYITKEEYACTLRENQASCDNMKSDNREKEKEIFDMFNLPTRLGTTRLDELHSLDY